MEIKKADSTSFGRIGFTDKNTKKLFYERLHNKNFMGTRNSYYNSNRKAYCKFLVENENRRHDRTLKIGLKNIKGKEVFTYNGEAFGINKNGNQSMFDFLIGVFKQALKK